MGEMCWKSKSENDTKVLHLRASSLEPWLPYTSHPKLMVPDYKVNGGSRGYATMQKLLKANWNLVQVHEN